MQSPKFPFLMPVWSNLAGILRPDEADGRPPRMVVAGVRLERLYNQDAETVSFGAYEYMLVRADDHEKYGWVSEAELVKQEYPADDTVPLEEHPDLDDVRNMPATSVG